MGNLWLFGAFYFCPKGVGDGVLHDFASSAPPPPKKSAQVGEVSLNLPLPQGKSPPCPAVGGGVGGGG